MAFHRYRSMEEEKGPDDPGPKRCYSSIMVGGFLLFLFFGIMVIIILIMHGLVERDPGGL